MTSGFRARTGNIIPVENGKLLTNDGVIVEIWEIYSDIMLNGQNYDTQHQVFYTAQVGAEDPSKDYCCYQKT